MTFDVDVARLAVVPHWLDQLADDADACAAYAGRAFDFDHGPGVLNRVTGVHGDLRAAVTGYFGTVADRARQLSKSIDRCVHDYEAMDAETAASFDALLPIVDRSDSSRFDSLRPDIPQAKVRPLNEPTAQLKPLTDYLPEWPYEPTWADLVSPANICRDVLMGVNWLGVQMGLADRIHDPFDFSQCFSGNWAGMKACSDALRNLSLACADLQGNCTWIELRVNAVWRGNAADAAWLQLNDLAGDLGRGASALEHFSADYAEVVDEMAKLEEIAEIAIGEAIDWAVLAVIGSCTAASGVGIPLVQAAVAVKVVATVRMLGKVVTLMDALGIGVNVFNGKVSGRLGVLQIDQRVIAQLEYSNA